MQINNVASVADKCTKPHRFLGFTGNESSSSEKKKVRYKHYEELSDDVLSARSIIKAHQDVQNSGKMRLFKAIPAIATGIFATSLALTRPGKLSEKAATGLGFLATVAGVDTIADLAFPKGKETNRKKAITTLGAIGAVALGAAVIAKGAGKSEKVKKVTNFISNEVSQLASEVDKTKLANFSNKHIQPFLEKHPKVSFIAPLATAIGSSVLGGLASVGLLQGISQDISKKACENFEHAKLIQQIAKNHYDSVDAIEV
ncbi:MAG: hypothetical protein IJ877_02270 [Candidatus Gastranaerophilales bacterium]|nr:hypothetical protein [Candidatus Gastranaerophilales bacterium]